MNKKEKEKKRTRGKNMDALQDIKSRKNEGEEEEEEMNKKNMDETKDNKARIKERHCEDK